MVAGTPLRVLQARDEALYCALYGDPEAMRHVGAVLTVERARAAFARVMDQLAARPPRVAYWLLPRRVDAGVDVPPAGLLALQAGPDADDHAEVGVLLPRDAQGAGVASAGIAALADVVFTSTALPALWTRHARGNAAAGALMRRLGFQVAVQDIAGECRWQLTRARWAQLRGNPAVQAGRATGTGRGMQETW
ncbi:MULTISPECIES: GNAT family N-acetyltransferase [unclassified Luteimonas]|uniref:GNAT family N-acetyltransferase n=1 Tax=unclassified Luteimonas TaxID=2629088 RepID=UPI0018F0AB1D|nr:GNAT family N-acetyltransferase [Luteimonas sp. MC1572]MBJ7573933.1 GNAT family N-acetyltransferase [Luteimonas sp. MC1828]QQO02168.1 GNAT family N-acetyltransferase [Luteimonas sp. MC1572]